MPTIKATGQPVPWPGDAWDAQSKKGISHAGTAPKFLVGTVDKMPLRVWGSDMPDN